ncbi:MAG: hypothetical protein K9K37_03330 [Desulfocapsa sp.]|nr:hypothetical protein [Desulfocapsa sp.]
MRTDKKQDKLVYVINLTAAILLMNDLIYRDSNSAGHNDRKSALRCRLREAMMISVWFDLFASPKIAALPGG